MPTVVLRKSTPKKLALPIFCFWDWIENNVGEVMSDVTVAKKIFVDH